jgi:ADP-ribose pyrophosphatase
VTDEVREPGGKPQRRDVVRHPGSVVVLCDDSKSKRDPLILMSAVSSRRCAYLYEVPAGSLDQ